MAKNTSGAVHLTSLDLDISKISEQLNNIKDAINFTAEEIPKIWNSGIDSGGTVNILEKLGINDIPKAEEKVQELVAALGSYQKLELQAKGGELFKAIATQANDSGIAIKKVIDLTKNLNEALSSATVVDTSPQAMSKRASQESETWRKYRESISKEQEKITKITLEESGKRNRARETELEFIKKMDEQGQFSSMKAQEDYLLSLEKSVQSLSSAYEKLGERVKKIDIPEDMMNKFTRNVQTALDKLATMQSDLSFSQVVPQGFENQVKTVQKVYEGLSKAIESTRVEQEKLKKETKEAYNSIQQSVKSNISDLKILEKSATFANSRKEAAGLRTEFEKLYSEIKSGNVDLKTAQSNFSSLEERFENFKGSVKTGTTALQNFVDKISESTKWQIANSLLNLLEKSFSNLLGTITDTENAVIELRRVLSDAPIAAEISDELYQIAYDFGQTFENVQDVAVRFAQTGMDWQEVVDATRATMLGLNTAELEVTSATQGLIAVMAQFHIEASDLESVIDKINTTADHFPVTSEKIVAALQRAGGTASAFGMTLEETIGVITALSEATGRAGESIGTSLNSLISFSMKDTALEKFSEFLEKDVSDYGVLQLWKELSAAIKGGNTELATMMSQSEEFSDLMDETLASSIGLEEEYNLALKEGNAALKDGRDIYSTVGTYRQNYFIALLNNIETATEAMDNMGDALGYSLQENETAMTTFTKQWNQLVVSAQELAVQFGESGFLEISKSIVDIGTSALKTAKNFGGLSTALLATSTLFFAIKKEKINDYFKNQNTIISNSGKIFSAYQTAVKSGATATKAFSVALKSVELSTGGVITIISAVVTTIAGIVGAMKAAKEEAKELREETIRQGEAAVESSKNFSEAIIQYTDALEAIGGYAKGDATEAISSMLEQLGYEMEDIPVLVKRYGDLKTAIEELTKTKYEYLKLEAQEGAKAARESINDLEFTDYDMPVEQAERLNEFFVRPESYEQAKELTKELEAELSAYGRTLTETEKKTDGYYLTIKDGISVMKNYTGKVEDADAAVDLFGNSVEDWIKNTEKANEAAKNAIDSISGTGEVSGTASISLEQLSDSIKELETKYNNISASVDGFQSAYSSIIGIIEEYNETGIMTADMMQSLIELEPEYIDLLNISSDSISINEEKLNDLIAVNDTRIQQLAAVKYAQEAEELATRLSTMAKEGATEAEIIAAMTTEALAGKLEQTAYAYLTGKKSADDLKAATSEFAKQCGISGEAVETYTNKLFGLANGYLAANQAFDRMPGEGDTTEITPEMRNAEKYAQDRINLYYKPKKSGGVSSSSKSTKDPFEEKLKAEKEALDALIDSYEHQIFLMERNSSEAKEIAQVYRDMQKTVHEQAEKYRSMGLKEESDQIRSMQKLWWEYQDEIEAVLQGIYEATIESHENALSLLENQFEKASESMDYSWMSENLQKQLSYQKKIQEEAHKEAQRLRKLGVDENDEAIQSCIDAWWKADDAIQEINSRIEESILSTYDDFIDLADEFDLWEYMDFTKVDYLKAKLDDINKLLREGTISLKEYNELLKQWNVDMFNAQKQLIQQQQDDVKKRSEDVIKGYENKIKLLEKKKDDSDAYYNGVIAGYETEIEAWNKRKDEVENYYDTLIDNLNEVQEANDRINAQIDYYNARQKIITNLEQAQARSGVAWREKEMEYQQQLIDLDEDWNRTQEDWKLEDQIEELQKLKEQATADIDATIEKIQQSIEAAEEASKAAVDAIDQEIAGIQDTITAVEEQAEHDIQSLEDQITNLSQEFSEAIKSGMSDGMIDSKEEFDKAVTDGRDFLLSTVDESGKAIEEKSEETGKSSAFAFTHSFSPALKTDIDDIAEHMKSSIQSGAKTSAEGALKAFQTSFVSPLKSQIASLMNEVQKINISYDAKSASVSSAIPGSSGAKKQNMVAARGTGNLRTSQKTPTNVYISNYNTTSEAAAGRTKNILQQILN